MWRIWSTAVPASAALQISGPTLFCHTVSVEGVFNLVPHIVTSASGTAVCRSVCFLQGMAPFSHAGALHAAGLYQVAALTLHGAAVLCAAPQLLTKSFRSRAQTALVPLIPQIVSPYR